jgi:hypothetical protein
MWGLRESWGLLTARFRATLQRVVAVGLVCIAFTAAIGAYRWALCALVLLAAMFVLVVTSKARQRRPPD